MASAAERSLFWGTAGAVVVSDFVTKMLAESLLARRLPLALVGDVVQLRLVYNQGAAFGLDVGENSRWVFFGLAIVALVVLGSMVRSTRAGEQPARWPQSAVFARNVSVGQSGMPLCASRSHCSRVM